MAARRDRPWRPADEAEATSNMAVFVEWLRATGRRPDASPAVVRAWWAAEPDRLLAAVGAFLEIGPDQAPRLPALAHALLLTDLRPDDGAPEPRS